MLSWSIQETNQRINLLPIADGEGDTLLTGGSDLIGFANATLSGCGISAARTTVADALGTEAAVDAAAVIGNFEMMNRVVDGTGVWSDEVRAYEQPGAAPQIRPAKGVHIAVPWTKVRNDVAVVVPLELLEQAKAMQQMLLPSERQRLATEFASL